QSAGQAAVPTALTESTLKAAGLFATGQTLSTTASTTVLLATRALKNMGPARLATTAFFLLAGVLVLGGGLLTVLSRGEQGQIVPPRQAAPTPGATDRAASPARVDDHEDPLPE